MVLLLRLRHYYGVQLLGLNFQHKPSSFPIFAYSDGSRETARIATAFLKLFANCLNYCGVFRAEELCASSLDSVFQLVPPEGAR